MLWFNRKQRDTEAYLDDITSPPSEVDTSSFDFGDVYCPECGQPEYVRTRHWWSLGEDTHRCASCKITFTP